MDKKNRTLLNHTAAVLKLMVETEGYPTSKVRVDYKFSDNQAYIYLFPKTRSTGNGHERTYDWDFVDNLVKLSGEKGISYKIGHTDGLELHIQIYI